MNLLSLMAMAKMMKITNLEKNMLNLRHLPRILNQERLLKARKAPSLRSKTSCNLNLKRWPCSILQKKFAKLWVTSFSKLMKILQKKRRKNFEMSCSSIKSGLDCSGIIRGMFGECSGSARGIFGECSGNVRGRKVLVWLKVKTKRKEISS